MKIHFLSDLHLEFGSWPSSIDLNSVDADVTVLAGDIGEGLEGIQWAMKIQRPVIYVMGNHEFYGKRAMSSLWKAAREAVRNTHIHLLENDEVAFNDVRFVGTTLWTDFKLFGDDVQAETMAKAKPLVADYREIHLSQPVALAWSDTAGSALAVDRWEPAHAAIQHAKARQFLEQAIGSRNPNETLVVVTHHAPSLKSLAPRLPMPAWYAAYASNLDQLAERADLWIHGHEHRALDYRLGLARVVCNPRGYVNSQVVEGYEPHRVIDTANLRQ